MVSKTLSVGVLVVVVLILIRYSWSAIQKPLAPILPVTQTEESFKVAPRRAADCKCLAGYVPSKKGGDIYFCQSLSNPATKRECY